MGNKRGVSGIVRAFRTYENTIFLTFTKHKQRVFLTVFVKHGVLMLRDKIVIIQKVLIKPRILAFGQFNHILYDAGVCFYLRILAPPAYIHLHLNVLLQFIQIHELVFQTGQFFRLDDVHHKEGCIVRIVCMKFREYGI